MSLTMAAYLLPQERLSWLSCATLGLISNQIKYLPNNEPNIELNIEPNIYPNSFTPPKYTYSGVCVALLNFLCLSDKRLLTILIKKKLKKINLKVRFLPLKIAFFEGFENDNILSSTSYTVTKSGISPQRKLGSLQNLKLKLIR